MELSQLEYFIVLCKYGSYTKASEELHVSQPAISAAIRKLSDECNDSLVMKKNGEFSLTPKGQVLLKGAVKIHDDLNKLHSELDAFSMRGREVIRLAVPFPLCPELFEETIPRFGTEHTDVAMHLLQEGHSNIVSGIRSKSIDIGVVCKDVLVDDLDRRPYKKLEYYACFSPDHKLAKEQFVTPEMLKGEKLIIPSIANTITGAIQEYFSCCGFEPDFHYLDVFPAEVGRLALKGEGIAFMPAHSHIAGSAPLNPPLYAELYTVWLKDQPLTANRQALIDYICEGGQNLADNER